MYLWLKTTSRKTVMKSYGFYDGEINSKKDTAYYEAIGKVNKKYLPKKFQTKTYYKETDIVLRNLRNLELADNFKLEEFRCNCNRKYCSGYPVVLDRQLLINLQTLRNKYGPITVSGKLRCQKYNDSIPGSIKKSAHTKGKALDIDLGSKSDTLAERKKIMAEFKKMPKSKYTYCDEGKNPNMGNSIHIEVK